MTSIDQWVSTNSWDVDTSDDVPFSEYFEHKQKIAQFNAAFGYDPCESPIIERFKSQQATQRDLFSEKHKHYGASNILDGDHTDPEVIKESLHSLYVRMRDKLNRFKTLIDNPNTSAETMRDTLDDLSNYSNIAIVVSDGAWNDNF